MLIRCYIFEANKLWMSVWMPDSGANVGFVKIISSGVKGGIWSSGYM